MWKICLFNLFLSMLGCSSSVSEQDSVNEVDSTSEAVSNHDSPFEKMDMETTTLVFPLYALVSTGPNSARLLWVPWDFLHQDRIMVERSSDGENWEPVDFEVFEDSALVTNLHDNDVLRVFVNHAGKRVAESVSLEFRKSSKTPSTIAGHRIVSGLGEQWEVSPDLILGTGEPPKTGDVLVLPITPQQMDPDVRLVTDVALSNGGWRVDTTIFDPTNEPPFKKALQKSATSRGLVSMNTSLDGIQVARLMETHKGYRGYCSVSGWGCIEFSEKDLERHHQNDFVFGTTPLKNWYHSLSWSYTDLGNGMSLTTTSGGGIKSQMEYEYGIFPPRLISSTVSVEPYANATVALNLNNSDPSIDVTENLVHSSAVIIYANFGVKVAADFGIDAVVDLDSENNFNVTGSWTAQVDTSKEYEVGYLNGGYIGPNLNQTNQPTLTITPSFNDGSEVDIWFGWRAQANVYLRALNMHLVNANASATVGVVFNHESTDGTKCDATASLSHIQIDEGISLDAELEVPFLNLSRTFNLFTQRNPLLSWGRERTLGMAQRVQPSNTDFTFRLKSGTAQPTNFGQDDVDVSDPTQLTTYINGTEITSPISIVDGSYSVAHGLTLQPGTYDFAVWLPENDSPLLMADGQCVSTTVEVQ